MPADTGATAHLVYYWEDNGFASSPTDSTAKVFGSDLRFTSAEGNNQLRQVYQPGSRVPVETFAQVFEGRWGVEFLITNPWWLQAVLGSPSQTDNSDGSYTYDYTGTTPQSMNLVYGLENSDKERSFKGCVPTQMRIQPRVREGVQVTLEGAYAKEEVVDQSGSGGVTTTPSLSHNTLTFVDASVSLAGSTKALVQNANLSVPLNTEMIPEFGSRFPADYFAGTRAPTVDVTEVKTGGSTASVEELYGGDTTQQDHVDNQSAMTFLFDNGDAAGSGINKLQFDLTGTTPDTYSDDNATDPESRIEESINRTVQDITASATNEVSSAP